MRRRRRGEAEGNEAKKAVKEAMKVVMVMRE